MSRQLQILVGVAAGLVLAAGAFVYFLYMPELAEAKTLRESLAVETKKLDEAKMHKANEKGLDDRHAGARRGLDYATRRLPGTPVIADVLDQVSRAASRARVRLTLIEPQKPTSDAGVSDLPIRVILDGGFHGYGMFLTEIAGQPRIFSVTDVVMTTTTVRGREDATMQATMMLHTYYVDSPK